MQLPDLLKRDNFSFGFLLGILIPIPLGFILIGVLTMVQRVFLLLPDLRNSQMFFLSMALNLLVMRFYLVKLKYEHTGKGLLISTMCLIVLYLVFNKFLIGF